MEIPFYQVDAFADKLFAGNPAAVCPLGTWLPDSLLQSIAAENNLAETAYFVPENSGYTLRWFTPSVEVDLCGHATIASAYVVMNCLTQGVDRVVFETRSGPMPVERRGDRYFLDFPCRPGAPASVHPELSSALRAKPKEVRTARDIMAVFESEDEVRALQPDFAAIAKLDTFAVIATAPGNEVDFVSRFFAPKQGIPEDPVTGSAHCTLIPYWAEKLGKTKLVGRQISPRGGVIECELRGDRVSIGGGAVLFASGNIHLPG
ncbi:MAG TPA: PhzF family phenazine biosynthesis protein [Bryobacteraceae bacterium]|nr:PhzF family phenazine biosynthesis protein [Bryobacteraceae bacterium]